MNYKNLLLYSFVFPLIFISAFTVTSTDVRAQPPGNCIYLNGSTDYITVPNNSALNQGTTMSAEAWIRPCSVSGTKTILSLYWCAGFQNAYTLTIVDSALRWTWDTDGCGNGASYFQSDQKIMQTEQWQHIAVVHRTDTIILYLNGQKIQGNLISGNFSSIQSSTEPLRIGVIKALNGNLFGYFEGQIDELRLWDYPITSTEIASRFNTNLFGNESGLIAYYNMDQTGMGNMAITNNTTPINTSLFGTSYGTASSPVFQDVLTDPCSSTGLFESNLINSKCPVDISFNGTSDLIEINANSNIIALSFTDLQGRSYTELSTLLNRKQVIITRPKHLANGLFIISIETEKCTSHSKLIFIE